MHLREQGDTLYGFRIRRNGYYSRRMPGPAASPQEDLYRRIIDALVVARREAKLRQVDVAERVGWPQAYVSRYENHERSLSVSEYVAVARAVDADPVALLAGLLAEDKL